MNIAQSIWIVLLLAYLVTVIGLISTVILENRNPLKTSAWVLIIAFIPIVGVLSYIVFGQKQRRRSRINRRYYNRLLKSPNLISLLPREQWFSIDPWKKLIKLLEHNSHSLLLPIKSIDTYTSGGVFYADLINDINQASEHIHLESYIFEDGRVFALLSEALIRKRREGVDVRIIYDYLGSYSMPEEQWQTLIIEGIQVYPFLPVRIPLLSSTVNYRNHRKICVIDSVVAYVGGMNFADRYQDGDKLGPWRDTHFRLTGAAVLSLQGEFLADWYTVSRRVVSVERFFSRYKVSDSDSKIFGQFVFGGPFQSQASIEQAFVSLIHQAKSSIYIQTPYFLPTETLASALTIAALSGIEIHLMIPHRGDSSMTGLAMDSYLSPLLKVGVQVYRYHRGFIHSKIMTIDREIAVIGSANMDFRSLEHNFELSGVIYDATLAQGLTEEFIRDTADSHHLSPDVWERRSLVRKRLESTMRLFAPLL